MFDPDSVYSLLKEIYLIIDDGDRRLLSRFNLTLPRFYALYHLGEGPGMSLRQLSERMLCDKSNITRIIKGMESDGLVTRQPHESDGRVLRLFLTESGETVREQVLAAHARYNTFRFSGLDGYEQPRPVAGALLELKAHLQERLGEAEVAS